MQKGASHFKTFPEFSKLTLADRDYYENFMSKFPPTIQFSFPALMLWWSVIDDCLVSELNGNLVFSFWVPGMEEDSGLSVLGDNRIDETICEIFDHQKSVGQAARIVHIPDFVIRNCKYPDMFRFASEPNYDEPVISVKDFSSVDGLPLAKRRHVRSYFVEFDEKDIEVKSIDIDKALNKETLANLIDVWAPAGPLNDYARYEELGLRKAIELGSDICMDCIGLYINGLLHSFFMYQMIDNSKQVNMGYTRFSYQYPHLVDLSLHEFAKWLENNGVEFVNLDSDLGLELLRTIKVSLAPSRFVRMYTVNPTTGKKYHE